MFIVVSRFVGGPRGLHQPDAFGRSDLRRGNERKHINVWLLRPSRFLGQVVALIGAPGHARAAARSRCTDPCMGHDSRAGSRSSTAAHSFEAPGGSGIALVSTVGPALVAIGPNPAVTAAPLGGLFDTSGLARAFWAGAGSIPRPYNTRLHQTAPRAFSSSARGEPV